MRPVARLTTGWKARYESPLFECPPQIGHQIRTLPCPIADRWFEQDVSRFPSRLGPVHRQVCFVQQVGGGDGPLRFGNDEPDTGRDRDILAINGKRGLQGSGNRRGSRSASCVQSARRARW